jgi:ankyrin repeat protein
VPKRLAGIILEIIPLASGLFAQASEKIDFARDIQPLFRANCYGCHGPTIQSSNFRLDRRRDSLPNRVGANGARVVPGNSANSRLYLRITGQAGLQMPPIGALSAEQIATVKAWIDQGAEWPDELAGDTPSIASDSQSVRLMDALRRGDHATFEKTLRQNPKAAKGQNSSGSTPLMYAALYGDARAVQMLLDQGANANRRNDAGATALLWAADQPAAVRILLEHGADPNIRSADGLTPLLLAAARIGGSNVVKLLLDYGAKLEGQAVLMRAAAAGDEATMRLLIDRRADRKPLPADLALRSGCTVCVNLLLPAADKDDLNRALAAAARFGDSKIVTMLLDRGATASSAALRLAASSEKIPTEAVDALLARGARDDSALAIARLQGDTPVVAALKHAGAKDTPTAADPPSGESTTFRTTRAAVEKSLPLLQKVDVVFLGRAGCVSCHNNSLTEMTIAVARRNGFAVNEAATQAQMNAVRTYLESWRERVLQDIPIPGGVDTVGYILVGLAAADYPPDTATDSLVRYLRHRQSVDGGWRIAAQRPPIESSDFMATAVTLRALKVYTPTPLETDYSQAVRKGVAWLAAAKPETNEDRMSRAE